MCCIAKRSPAASAPKRRFAVLPTVVLVVAVIIGLSWSLKVPFRIFSPGIFGCVVAAIIAWMATLAWFVNFYTASELRKCSPVTEHLLSVSKKSLPPQCEVDLDKVASPEGLSKIWRDEVQTKEQTINVLLTGVTGYVGRSFLFHFLREIAMCDYDVADNIPKHKVYVLSRAKESKNLSAADRLNLIRDEPMFAPLRKQWEKIVVTVHSGDLQDDKCGMSQETLQMLADAKITHVVHCAADVNFNRPLAESAGINISPVLKLQALAKEWPTCHRLVHCSTAFVNPGCGTPETPMAEDLYSLGKYDPQDLYDSMRGDQQLALEAKNEMAFPNNYVFTKCVAEHLVVQNNKRMALKIVRPAIVGPAWVLPEPGWNGDKPSTISALFLLWGTRVLRVAPLTTKPLPVVPVDVVAVGILHAMITSNAAELGYLQSTDSAPNRKSVSIRNLIWSHRSPNSCAGGMEMAKQGIPAAILKHHFTSTEAAVSFALIDCVYKLPIVFPIVHLIFNLGPLYLLQLVCWIIRLCGIKSILDQLPVTKLLKFSDMINLYKPYMGREYYFESSMNVPESMDRNQYCASLFKATHSFWTSLFPGTIEDLDQLELLPEGRWDFWWALTAPSRSLENRIIAYLACKVLRALHGSALVDMSTLILAAKVMTELEKTVLEQNHCVLIASMYQSTMDYVLTKYIAFSMAGLGIDVPHNLAMSDFRDAKLSARIGEIKSGFDRHATLAAFVKEPSTTEAFLRTLVNSPGHHDYTMIPLCVDYKEPENTSCLMQPKSANIGVVEMFSLYWQVCIQGNRRRRSFGAARVSYGKPISLKKNSNLEFAATHVRLEHCRLTTISDSHLAAAERHLKIPSTILKNAVEKLGVPVVVVSRPDDDIYRKAAKPADDNWKLHQQWIPNFAPYLKDSHPQWAFWVSGGVVCPKVPAPMTGEIEEVMKVICAIFDAAEYLAIRAKISLHQKNVKDPNVSDLVKEMEALEGDLKCASGSLVFEAAASFAVKNELAVNSCQGEEDEKKEF
jgi:thioester reductase-like protein